MNLCDSNIHAVQLWQSSLIRFAEGRGNTRSGIKYTEAGKLVSFMRKGQCSLSDFLDAIKYQTRLQHKNWVDPVANWTHESWPRCKLISWGSCENWCHDTLVCGRANCLIIPTCKLRYILSIFWLVWVTSFLSVPLQSNPLWWPHVQYSHSEPDCNTKTLVLLTHHVFISLVSCFHAN